MKHTLLLLLSLVSLVGTATAQQGRFDIEAYKAFLEAHTDISAADLQAMHPVGLFAEGVAARFDEAFYSDSIGASYDLTDYERSLLDQHGFMVTERLAPNSFGDGFLDIYKKNLPIFVPALADCSAGFGFIVHQTENPVSHVSLDSAKDFLELTRIKLESKDTGIFMVGGGVPKNFTQDIVVSADILEEDTPMHKYAIQITVADQRDGALSGSTLKEASSWGKVETTNEQMVFSEATLALPLIAGYCYHKGSWKNRGAKELQKLYSKVEA